jgi:hypothetical protein
MQQKEDESIEDFVERFLYNLQKSKHARLNDETLGIIFLREVRDEYIDILNLMGFEDVSQPPLA